jgi:nicotinamidase-related amidase
MTKVQTLLEMAGAKPEPAALHDATVVIIDAQRVYVDGALPLTNVGPALAKVRELLKRARAAGVPVVHVVHVGDPGDPFDPADGGRIADEAAPRPGEPVVEKRAISAFANTDLDSILKVKGRPKLVLAGFMTHMCVSSTARAALDMGYSTTVVSDATATRALPDTAGKGAVEAEALQRASLAAINDLFAVVSPLAALPD